MIKADICVIGAGAAGLSVAAGAAQLGAKTMLVEAGEMGGDCLNYGCVPSKALLAAAKRAHDIKTSAQFGISTGAAQVDWTTVKAHVDSVIAEIAPHDSQDRFEGLGCTVLRNTARFLDKKTVQVGDEKIRARRFVIATGTRPKIPDIEGLADVPYLTNETLFSLDRLPRHLLIIGGGPIGMEMAQAFVRLGAEVSVFEQLDLLGKDDRNAAKVVIDALSSEGVRFYDHCTITHAEKMTDGVTLVTDKGTVSGSHLLVATGRTPNIETLDLSKAGVEQTHTGIKVNAGLKTTNSRIYAIGDVTGGLLFTHVAGYDASIVVKNALFRLPAKAHYGATPWVTYTDPELAHVGMSEAEARSKHGEIRVVTSPFSENDRARAEREKSGFIKVVTTERGRILGATIVGPGAGDLIQSWTIALTRGMKIRDFTGFIAPYPTRGEISKRVAGEYYKDSLFSAHTRRLVKVLSYFG